MTYHTSDVLQELKVAEDVDACEDKFMPMDTLQFNVGMVFLEVKVKCLEEVDVWALDAVRALSCEAELSHVEVLWEYLHNYIIIISLFVCTINSILSQVVGYVVFEAKSHL